MSSNLILYFSRAGENYMAGDIVPLERGNTQLAAELIQQAVDGDLFEIEAAKPYPQDYRACVERAKEELAVDGRPALKGLPDVSGYDVVFLGYPNWCGTVPMPVASVLEALDLTGKRLRPFCTNEGSGLGASMADIRRLARGCAVAPGLSIVGHRVAQSREAITSWAQQH